jgi:hypothetical protein
VLAKWRKKRQLAWLERQAEKKARGEAGPWDGTADERGGPRSMSDQTQRLVGKDGDRTRKLVGGDSAATHRQVDGD